MFLVRESENKNVCIFTYFVLLKKDIQYTHSQYAVLDNVIKAHAVHTYKLALTHSPTETDT